MDYESLFKGSNLRGRALLEHVVRHIAEHPEQFDMTSWFDSKGSGNLSCDTVGCLAGWTLLCTAKVKTYNTADRTFPNPAADATEQLDITSADAERLFHAGTWCDANRSRYFDAALVIEHYDGVTDLEEGEKKDVEKAYCDLVRALVDEVNDFIASKKTTDPKWFNYGKEPKKAARTRHAKAKS